MNDRKKNVLKTAHQLFIDKGFQATSIQDILDESGISKGTFYNYFSSKNELLMAIFISTFSELEKNRNEILIGQDRSNIEIFIKQIEMQMKSNRENKLISLLEEVMTSNDVELKQFIELGKLRTIRWVYQRFIDIFGEDKKPYLLDCAIMFMGILRENIKFYHLAYDQHLNIERVVRYSVKRLARMVEGIVESGDQLLPPEWVDTWDPAKKNCNQAFQRKLQQIVVELKKAINHHEEHAKFTELFDFIQDEFLDSKNPRKYLIESALFTLSKALDGKKDFEKFKQMVSDYFMEAIERI